jgi:hypothetical protein
MYFIGISLVGLLSTEQRRSDWDNAKVSGGWCGAAFAQSWCSHAQEAAEHQTSE